LFEVVFSRKQFAAGSSFTHILFSFFNTGPPQIGLGRIRVRPVPGFVLIVAVLFSIVFTMKNADFCFIRMPRKSADVSKLATVSQICVVPDSVPGFVLILPVLFSIVFTMKNAHFCFIRMPRKSADVSKLATVSQICVVPDFVPGFVCFVFCPTCHMRLDIFLSKHMCFISQSMPRASIPAARCLLEQKPPFLSGGVPLFGNGLENVQNICVLPIKTRKCLYFACGVHSQRTLWESAFCVCAVHFWHRYVDMLCARYIFVAPYCILLGFC
jgi:hypothetical protein